MNWFRRDIFSLSGIQHFIKWYARADNWHELDSRTGNIGYGWIHYSLIRLAQPERVLVIGSRYGFIPAICALGCKHNHKGIVDFVDAGYDQQNHNDRRRHWGGVGFWTSVNLKQHFGSFGLHKRIRLYVATSEHFYSKNPTRTWNYIYLDGDHSYDGIKEDFSRYWPRLQKGGFLSIHDIRVKSLGGFDYGVWRLWSELKRQHKRTIELPGKYGLGVIQK